MKPTVYVETTIPSYYHDERVEIRRDILRTREWWDTEMGEYECFVSPVVVAELEQGDYPHKDNCLDLIAQIPVLEISTEIEEIAEVYCRHHAMPRQPFGDAAHLAVASYYRMEYLLTWNCRHLANARKEEQLRRLNDRLGLWLPRLVTPHNLQLLED